VLAALLRRLHAEGILYCHWKSNEHLAASMQGETDLDLLVDRSAAVALTRILSGMDCKRVTVRAGRGYPGVEDYLAFDRATGALVHLHVHYQLTLGERFLKGYRLPWEELLLTRRVLDEEHGIYVAEPAVELLLLVVRAALKVRTRDRALAVLGRHPLRGHALRELRWLAERARAERVMEVSRPFVGERAARALVTIGASQAPTLAELLAFRRLAEPSLREHRLYGAARAHWLRWTKEAAAIAEVAAAAIRRLPRTSTRTPPQGGLTVAFIGSPGAAASALARAIVDWLAWEVAVVALLRRHHRAHGGADRARGVTEGALATHAWRERSRGRIVILDSLPQHGRPELHPPDIVVQLQHPSEAAEGRESSVRANRLRLPYGARVIELDASRPREDLLLDLKRIIWDSL
jgi:hypothetical protein